MKRKWAELLNIIFGFRKSLVLLLIIIIGIIFRTHNLVDGEQFVELLKTTTIAYMATYGIEYAVENARGYMKDKGSMSESGPADTDESNDEEEVTVEGL